MAICVSLEQNNAVIDSVTFNGTACTLLDAQAAATFGRTEVWVLVPPAAVTGDVVISWGAPSSRHVAGVIVASGVDQAGGTASFRTPAKSTTAIATDISNTVASVGTDDLVFDSLAIDGTGHAAAPGADQTERWDQETTAGANTGCGSTQPGSAGGVMSWSWSTLNPACHIASAFISAAAPAPGPSPVAARPYRREMDEGFSRAWTRDS